MHHPPSPPSTITTTVGMDEEDDPHEYNLYASYTWIPEEIVVKHPQYTTLPFEIDDDAESVRSFGDFDSHEEHSSGNESTEMLIKCDFCPKRFSTKGELMLHTLSHSKTYNCDICSSNFKNESNLERHLMSHIEKESFKCSTCDESFDTILKLKEHSQKHSLSKNPWMCEKCSESFPTRNELVVHKKSHIKKRQFECEICSKQFSQYSLLKKHSLSVHFSKKSYNCRECGKCFSDTSQLMSHVKMHCSQKFKCKKCSIYFKSVEELHDHKKKHPVLLNPWACDKCDTNYPTRDELMHHKKIHVMMKIPVENTLLPVIKKPVIAAVPKPKKQKRQFTCITCNCNFINFNALKAHQGSHNIDNPWLCNKCDASFPQRNELMVHKKTCMKRHSQQPQQPSLSHDGQFERIITVQPMEVEEPIPIIEVEPMIEMDLTQSTQQESLNEASDHSSGSKDLSESSLTIDNPWPCNKCGARFTHREELTAHKRTHISSILPSQKKKFKCNMCDKNFDNVILLREHKKSHLSKEKENPWLCHQCNASFPNREAVVQHKKSCMKICGVPKNTIETLLIPEPPVVLADVELNNRRTSTTTSKTTTSQIHHPVKNPWICNKCEAAFPLRDELMIHRKTCIKIHPQMIHLEIDSDRSSSGELKELKEQEKRVTTNDNPWFCSKCDKCFHQLEDLFQHKKVCLKMLFPIHNNELGIEKLSSAAARPNKLKDSSKDPQIQSIQNPWECDKCNKGFPHRNELMVHKKTHIYTKTTAITILDKMSDPKDQLTKSSVDVKDNIYKCPTCSLVFNNSNLLREHLKKSHAAVLNPWICDKCNETFPNRDELITHKNKHIVRPPYKCEICGKEFSHNHHLKRHSFVHSGKKPFECHVCSKGFADSSDLKRHMKIHPGEQNLFKCETCNECYMDSAELKQHRKIHTTKCHICDQQFLHRCHLKRHLITHTGEKPFRCELCDMQFSRNYHLKRHIQTHTGAKPFKCDICSKQFTRDWHLKRHSRIHSSAKSLKCDENSLGGSEMEGEESSSSEKKRKITVLKERNFACETCEKRFTSPGRLRRHEQAHSSETPHKADTPPPSFLKQFNDSNSLNENMIFYTDSESHQWDSTNEKLVTFYCDSDSQFKPLSDEIRYVSNINEDIGSNEYLLSTSNQSEDRLSFIPFFSSLEKENEDSKTELKFQSSIDEDEEQEILD